jgi:hypothetical protein
MADQLNWKSRLEINANGKVVSAVESFTPTFNTTITPIHAVDADNIGAVFHPQTATFTLTVKAIGTNVAELTGLAISGTAFSISIAEKRGTDWTFKNMLFRDCLITSVNPSNVVMDGVPIATFNGIILGFTADTDRES